MDSIVVERPIDVAGNYIRYKFDYNKELLIWKNQFGHPIKYLIPPSNFGQQNFPLIQYYTYWINFYGQKAYGAMTNFSAFYSKVF